MHIGHIVFPFLIQKEAKTMCSMCIYLKQKTHAIAIFANRFRIRLNETGVMPK
jgi:hypothetical protein